MRPFREYPPDMPWAIVELRNQGFAIAAREVRELVMVSEVASIPNMPDFVRGAINLRGRVMPLVDLRKRLGMVSAAEETAEFLRLMVQREQDHKNWLAELEASVRERREFKLTTDPHKCAFGKWYDAYKSDNHWIANLLRRFDAPHKKIHGVGAQVQEFVASGEYERASRLIETARQNTLSAMIKLFASLRDLASEVQRDIAVVLTTSGRTFAVSIDAAVSVEKLSPGSIGPLPALAAAGHNGVVCRAGKKMKDEQLLLIIEADRVIPGDLV
jgi:chemotaxis signal transduction protein